MGTRHATADRSNIPAHVLTENYLKSLLVDAIEAACFSGKRKKPERISVSSCRGAPFDADGIIIPAGFVVGKPHLEVRYPDPLYPDLVGGDAAVYLHLPLSERIFPGSPASELGRSFQLEDRTRIALLREYREPFEVVVERSSGVGVVRPYTKKDEVRRRAAKLASVSFVPCALDIRSYAPSDIVLEDNSSLRNTLEHTAASHAAKNFRAALSAAFEALVWEEPRLPEISNNAQLVKLYRR